MAQGTDTSTGGGTDTRTVSDGSEHPAGLRWHEQFEAWQFPIVASLLVIALVGWVASMPSVVDVALVVATVVALVPATWESLRQLIRRDATADVVAVLAMAGALVLGEWLAGAIIALMLTGGEALEARAVGRARSELTSLLERAPRRAHRRVDADSSDGASTDGSDERLVDISIDEVQVGDVLVVKVGEVVPVDGMLLSDHAVLDESALTGESVPAEATAGQIVRSGVVNAGGPMELRATASAQASTYAGIVRLVEQASTERAPFVRVADRFAGWFLVVTIVLAAGAWLVSGDPVRALAVLVVATPCPLILAAPAAIIGGVSAAARRGVIVKGGGALEALADGKIVLLDKTGTVTSGRPRVAAVHPVPGQDAAEVLRMAGSLDQVSVHPFAPAIVEAAHSRSVHHGTRGLSMPQAVTEDVGQGIRGSVDGHAVRVGQLDYCAQGASIPPDLRRVRRRAGIEGRSVVYVAVDDALTGAISLHDPVRPDTPRAIDALRRAGVLKVVMLTGDKTEIADLVGDAIGVDQVLAERTPEEKVEAVRTARTEGRTIMVGDGINDAPALALADSGVAMGARGATAASEAADVVLTSDRLDGLADAVRIARRTRRIAWQSALVGIGLSAVAMVFAALGYLTPVAGAIVQEVIDLAVLANALRALRFVATSRRRRAVDGGAVTKMFAEHRGVVDDLDELVIAAEHLETAEPHEAMATLERLRGLLTDRLLPHEVAEEEQVFPVFRQAFDEEDPTVPLVRAHREITRRVRMFERLVADIDPDAGPDPAEVFDLQRALFGLHAMLEFHFGLEDELYASLEPVRSTASARAEGEAS
ncbi:MAG: heavy metal translocating P-type ATPase [Nitriliruptoraceae bacterium]